jgi:hypothetical protein
VPATSNERREILAVGQPRQESDVMNKFFYSLRSVITFTALLLVLAACGADVGTGDLPINDNPVDTPTPIATCIEDEPDCNDMGVTGDTPQDLPNDGDVVSPSSGMVVDGGLTISEALESSATGVLAVQGYLLDDGSGARFCEVLAESYPPQCGGASVSIVGYDEVVSVPLSSSDGTTWTDDTFVVFGEMVDGVLTVDPTVSG